MMASSVFVFLVLLLGVTFGLPLKSNEVEDFVFRANDLNRFSPYSDDDRTLLVERSVDPIGGGNLIRSLNMNDFDSNLVHGRQQVRRSAIPEGMNGDWNLGAERRNPYRYSWPRYGSIHSNFRRALDSIGGGHLIKRTLDSIGGANLIRNELANNPALLEYYLSILNSSSGGRSDGPSIEIIKKNFDEIDRTGFKHLKRNFDEIDRVGFSELKRSV